jgi:hypothetical protein
MEVARIFTVFCNDPRHPNRRLSYPTIIRVTYIRVCLPHHQRQIDQLHITHS